MAKITHGTIKNLTQRLNEMLTKLNLHPVEVTQTPLGLYTVFYFTGGSRMTSSEAMNIVETKRFLDGVRIGLYYQIKCRRNGKLEKKK